MFFRNDIKGKELAEGVCKRCVNKGLTGVYEGSEAKEARKTKDLEDKGVSRFIWGCLEETRSNGSGRSRSKAQLCVARILWDLCIIK